MGLGPQMPVVFRWVTGDSAQDPLPSSNGLNRRPRRQPSCPTTRLPPSQTPRCGASTAWSAPGPWKATWSAPTSTTSEARRASGGFRGGFFLEQRARIDFAGQQIDALELIGYDPETDTFPSTVFSGFSPTPLPYRWDVRDDRVTITVAYAPLDATFTGFWREDGTFAGGWRPNPGADQTVNVPYDIGGHRLK